QFDYIVVNGAAPGLLVDLRRRFLAHVVADHAHHVIGVEGARTIGGHRLTGNVDARTETFDLGEIFRYQYRGRSAAGGRTSHQLGHHARPDHRGIHHVVRRHDLPEQRHWIVGRMTAGFRTDLRERFQRRAVLLHVA